MALRLVRPPKRLPELSSIFLKRPRCLACVLLTYHGYKVKSIEQPSFHGALDIDGAIRRASLSLRRGVRG